MGHTVQTRGRIRIDPPIPWREIRESRYVRPHKSQDLQFEVTEQYIDTDEGKLRLIREAVAIVGLEDECRGDKIEQELVDIVRTYGEGRTFTGALWVRWPDFWSDEAPERRYAVVDGEPTLYEPTILWPKAVEWSEADG